MDHNTSSPPVQPAFTHFVAHPSFPIVATRILWAIVLVIQRDQLLGGILTLAQLKPGHTLGHIFSAGRRSAGLKLSGKWWSGDAGPGVAHGSKTVRELWRGARTTSCAVPVTDGKWKFVTFCTSTQNLNRFSRDHIKEKKKKLSLSPWLKDPAKFCSLAATLQAWKEKRKVAKWQGRSFFTSS